MRHGQELLIPEVSAHKGEGDAESDQDREPQRAAREPEGLLLRRGARARRRTKCRLDRRCRDDRRDTRGGAEGAARRRRAKSRRVYDCALG